MLVFEEWGKTGVPGEKPLGAELRTNKLSPHMPGPGIEPRTNKNWWNMSALTTTPTLLPNDEPMHFFLWLCKSYKTKHCAQ